VVRYGDEVGEEADELSGMGAEMGFDGHRWPECLIRMTCWQRRGLKQGVEVGGRMSNERGGGKLGLGMLVARSVGMTDDGGKGG
jgi:hypothetical protein